MVLRESDLLTSVQIIYEQIFIRNMFSEFRTLESVKQSLDLFQFMEDNLGVRPRRNGRNGEWNTNDDVFAGDGSPPIPDSRLPYQHYRELFTLRNYWKTVQRNSLVCAQTLLFKFLKDCPNHRQHYKTLIGLPWDADTAEEQIRDNIQSFDDVANKYIEVFDKVIIEVEANPTNVDAAIDHLKAINAAHKQILPAFDPLAFKDMEKAFLFMVSEILGDRFNEKAESLFQRFFNFCTQHLTSNG